MIFKKKNMPKGGICPRNFCSYTVEYQATGVEIKINKKGQRKFETCIMLFIPWVAWSEKFFDYELPPVDAFIKMNTGELYYLNSYYPIKIGDTIHKFKEGTFTKIKQWEWDYLSVRGEVGSKDSHNAKIFELVQDFYQKNYHN